MVMALTRVVVADMVNSGQIWQWSSMELEVSKQLLMFILYLMLLNIYMKIEFRSGNCIWNSYQRFWLKLQTLSVISMYVLMKEASERTLVENKSYAQNTNKI